MKIGSSEGIKDIIIFVGRPAGVIMTRPNLENFAENWCGIIASGPKWQPSEIHIKGNTYTIKTCTRGRDFGTIKGEVMTRMKADSQILLGIFLTRIL